MKPDKYAYKLFTYLLAVYDRELDRAIEHHREQEDARETLRVHAGICRCGHWTDLCGGCE